MNNELSELEEIRALTKEGDYQGARKRAEAVFNRDAQNSILKWINEREVQRYGHHN